MKYHQFLILPTLYGHLLVCAISCIDLAGGATYLSNLCGSSRICELCRSGIIGPLCNSDFEHSGHLKTCAAKIRCRLDSTLVCKTELLMPIHHKNWKFGVVYRCRSWSIFARHRSCICLGMCNPNSQAMLWLCLHRPDSVADRYCSLNKNPLGSWVMSNSAIDTSSGVVFAKERRTRRHMQTNQ